MPTIQLNFNNDLTLEKIKQIFKNRFESTYKVVDNAYVLGTDFSIQKSSFTGIAVKYVFKPQKQQAYIRFNAFIPSVAARFFLGGLLLYGILLLSSWPKITREIKEFVLSSPELNAMNYS